MLINGENIKTYSIDNLLLIKNRIANKLKILPRFLYLKNIQDEEYALISIHDVLKKQDLSTFYTDYKNGKFNAFEISKEELLHILYIEKNIKDDPYLEFSFIDSISNMNVSIDNIQSDMGKINTVLKKELDVFIDKQTTFEKNIEEFEKKKDISSDEFNITSTKLEMTFETNYDIYELFNNIKLSQVVPFACINDYYKLHKNFVPFDSWIYIKNENKKIDESLEVIYIKVLSTPNFIIKNKNLFSTVEIYFKNIGESSELNSVNIIFETKLYPGFNQEKFIKRILSVFPENIEYSKIEKSIKQFEIKGKYIIPDVSINEFLFSDYLINDDFISSIFFIDEFNKITRERINIYTMHGNSKIKDMKNNPIIKSLDGFISFSIEKSQSKLDVSGKIKNNILVKINKCKNISEANKIKQTINKLISSYISDKNNILRKYTSRPNVVSEIEKMEKTIIEKIKKSKRRKVMLKDINPDLFISNYQRLCLKPPVIVSEKINGSSKEVKKLIEKNIPVMLFPKYPDEGKQFYYRCEDEKYKYPYLKRNKLKNFDKYPVVPCCSIKNPITKKTSIYNLYYDGDTRLENLKDIKKMGKQYVYITNKTLEYNREGTIDKSIDDFLLTASIKQVNSEYTRIGSSKTTNSFLECVLKALYPKNIKITENEMNELSETTRKNIFEFMDEHLYLYDKDIYNNNSRYFEPRMFLRAVEQYFKCQVFIFSSVFGDTTTLVSPYFERELVLFKINNDVPCIFINEHMGTEFDNLSYPQCELILKKENDKISYNFKQNENIVAMSKKLYKELYPIVIVKNPVEIFKHKIVSQGLDYYNKTRLLLFDSDISVIINPVSILDNIPISSNFSPSNYKTVIKFLKEEDIDKYENIIVSGFLVGIKVSEPFEFYIPIKTIKSDEISNSSLVFPTGIYKQSQMLLYVKYQRITRHLLEYMYYIFSIWIKNNKQENIDKETLKTFADENIIIDSEFKYPKINRIFDIKSPFLKDEKIVVNTSEMKKKLVYSLILKIQSNKNELINYSTYKYMKLYYENIEDFNKTENDIILFGQDSLVRYIETTIPSYKLYNDIQQIQDLSTYLLQNGSDKIYVFIFLSKTHNKSLMRYIYNPLSAKYSDIVTKYPDVKFVYVTIEDNKNIFKLYNITSIPTIIFSKFDNNILKEISRIEKTKKQTETTRLLRESLNNITNVIN